MVAKFTTMASVWEVLRHDERVSCVSMLRAQTVRWSGVELALLPFVPLTDVTACLRDYIWAAKALAEGKRPADKLAARYARIYDKLLKACPDTPNSITLNLNDARVAHLFGAHPERPRLFKHVKGKEHVGTKLVFGKPHPDPQRRLPEVSLHPLGRGEWRVCVAPEYETDVSLWLMSNCM